MADPSDRKMEPPLDFGKHLEQLRTAYYAGDILALFQAIDFVSEQSLPLPTWASEPLEDTMRGIMTLRPGAPGRGNSSFGDLRKAYIRTVRASAYHYTRAWQRDPHHYADLPRRTLEDWYSTSTSTSISWSSMRTYSDAARLAGTSLHGTEFQANASTVRKAANCFSHPVRWGRSAVELRFQLRGPKGLFGADDLAQPDHVKTLLKKRKPK